MSHKTRVERHISVDLLAAVTAGLLVASFTTHQWAYGLLSLLGAGALFLLERRNITEEDQLEEKKIPPYHPPALSLSVKDVRILAKKSLHPATEDVPAEGLAFYIAGLEDGAAIQAEWVLNQLADSR